MKRNFAAQPEGGGEITILTGRDLMTEVTPNTFEERVFQKRPLFVDNCKNCDSMKNITGNKVYADASNSKNSWYTYFTKQSNYF